MPRLTDNDRHINMRATITVNKVVVVDSLGRLDEEGRSFKRELLTLLQQDPEIGVSTTVNSIVAGGLTLKL